MAQRRKSYEAGHTRKFLVVIDDTPECDRAIYYAARRAARTGGAVTMLCVIPPGDFQHWLGVENIMRADAQHEARRLLGRWAERVRAIAGLEPESVIREGDPAKEIPALIGEDEDIAILVLAAGTGKEGPGPLVSTIAGRASGTFPIPITIVPGNLEDADIDALA